MTKCTPHFSHSSSKEAVIYAPWFISTNTSYSVRQLFTKINQNRRRQAFEPVVCLEISLYRIVYSEPTEQSFRNERLRSLKRLSSASLEKKLFLYSAVFRYAVPYLCREEPIDRRSIRWIDSFNNLDKQGDLVAVCHNAK